MISVTTKSSPLVFSIVIVATSAGPQTNSSEALSIVIAMGSVGAMRVNIVDGKSLSGSSAQSRSPSHPYDALLNKSSGAVQLVMTQFSVTTKLSPTASAPRSKHVYPG